MRGSTRIPAMLTGLALAIGLASPAYADPPGFNGTIKIHAGDTESEPVVANEPHPGCTFHIHGFTFDAGSTGIWSITAWPPTGDGSTVVASGSWSASSSGEWRTAVMSLASGHHKASADQNGAPGGQKHKVFWIECPASAATPTLTPASEATPTPSPAAVSATATPTPTQLGVQTPPLSGVIPARGETPETPAAPGAVGVQTPQQVAGQETTPGAVAPGQQPVPGQQAPGQQQSVGPETLTGLPSTSAAPAVPAGLALIAPLAALLWRRIRR